MSFDVVLRNPGGGFNVVLSGGGSPPTAGYLKVWTGTVWELKPLKVWNGSAWVTKPVKRWNGTSWVVVHS